MRCLVYVTSADATWVKDFFSDIEPYLLKIVNKPLLEYYIDFAVLLKVKEIRIVSDTSIKEIEDWFKTGEKWGMQITYSLSRPEDSLNQVFLKNFSFCKEDDLLILHGYNFIDYDKNFLLENSGCSFKEGCYSDNSLLYLMKGNNINKLETCELPKECSIGLNKIKTITEYYQLSMDILKVRNNHYVLPGYSNEKDAFYGTNFIFPHSSEVTKPIMIGNNVRFQENTTVGPNVVMGDNVIIDSNTYICDSIIYDNSYVGCELELKEKIVYKNHLISGLNGDCVQITDKFLISSVDKGIILSYFDKVIQLLIACMLFLLQILPWLLIYPLVIIQLKKKKRQSEYFLSKSYHAIQLDDVEKLKSVFWGRVYLRLSLDKLPLLKLLFENRLILVGNHILSTTTQHRKLIKDLPLYQPGVYSLIESLANESNAVEEFIELEYLDTRCWRTNLKILFNILFRRLVYGDM